jgi:hypothetical protein
MGFSPCSRRRTSPTRHSRGSRRRGKSCRSTPATWLSLAIPRRAVPPYVQWRRLADCPNTPVWGHHRCASSHSVKRLIFSGISFAACLRSTSGARRFPIRWPVKSRSIVTRDPESPERASTDTFTIARIGPSTPRSGQRRGGSYSLISVVTSRTRPPIFRTVKHREPTVVVAVSRRPRTTPCCHSDMVLDQDVRDDLFRWACNLGA